MANKTNLADILGIQELNAQIDALKVKVNDLASSMSGMLKGGTNNGAVATMKEFLKVQNELAQAYKILESQVSTLSAEQKEQLTIHNQQKAVQKEIINDFKTQATAINMTANAYERLKAQSKIATDTAIRLGAALEMLKMEGKTTGTEFNNLSKKYGEASEKAQDLAGRLTKLEQATGKVTGRTIGAYGATFSLTQVMRELPNFAQSARIGFMSLSNNLPMLADDFRRLTKEIDINTGKQIGAGGALKIFSKELIGFNAIVIIATTLLTVYGDDIVKWAQKMLKGADATDKMNLSQKALYDQMATMNNETHSVAKRIQLLGVEIEKYRNGVGNADHIVKTYNETLGVHHGKLDDINKVMEVYKKQAAEYIEWTIAMNAATELSGKATDQLLRKKAAEKKLSLFNKDDVESSKKNINTVIDAFQKAGLSGNKAIELIREGDFNALSVVTNSAKLSTKEILNVYKSIIQLKKTANIDEISKTYMDIITAEFAQNKLTKAAISLFPKQFMDDKNGAGGGAGEKERQLAEVFKLEQDYSHWRAYLIEQNKELELKIAKETTEGTENAYEDRLEALKEYTSKANTIAFIDKSLAENQLAEKQAIELAQLKGLYERQQESYKGNKVKLKELEDNYENNKAIIVANGEKETLKIQDEYAAKTQDNLRDNLKTNLQIRSDYYDELVRLEEVNSKAAGVAYDQDASRKKIEQIKSESDSILDLFVSTQNKQQIAEDFTFSETQRKRRSDVFEAERVAIEKLENAKELQVGIEEAEIEYEAARKARLDAIAQEDIDRDNYVAERKKELFTEMQTNLFATLKQLEDNYFAEQQKQLDEEADKRKRINVEAIKDVEDREEAGVLSKKQAEDEKLRLAAYGESQQAEIERRKEELKRRQFLLDKGIALAQIVLDTAKGVTAAIASVITAPLVPFIIASGAAQAALVTAQTIPQFEKGVRGFEGGMAIVNEKRPEVIKEPNKSPYIYNGKNVLSYLPKGTDVYSSVDQAIGAGIIKDDNISIQRRLDRMIVHNSNFSDANIVNELVGLRSDMKRLRGYNKTSNGLEDARYYRNKLKGIA